MEFLKNCFLAFPIVALACICGVATWFDLKGRIIPNQLSYVVISVGFFYFLVCMIARVKLQSDGFNTVMASGLFEAMLGALICGIALLPFWWFGGIGGGDVKLVAALGVLLGPSSGLTVIFLGSLIALIFLFGSCLKRRVLSLKADSESRAANSDATEEAFELPMAGFFSAAALLVVVPAVI